MKMTNNGPLGFVRGMSPVGLPCNISATDLSTARNSWRLTRLHIEFTDDRSIFVTQSITPHLTKLLLFTPSLITLNIRTAREHESHSLDPSLIGFRSPPLPRLKNLSLRRLRVDKEAMLSLLKSQESLRKVFLGYLTLVDEGDWTEMAREAGLGTGAVRVDVRGLGYARDGDGWRLTKWEDESAWGRGERGSFQAGYDLRIRPTRKSFG